METKQSQTLVAMLKKQKKPSKPRPVAGNHDIRRSSERMLRVGIQQDGKKVKTPAQIQQQRAEQREWNERLKQAK